MSDVDDVKAVLDQWLTGLDSGDLDAMIASCDPEVVICNENQPTTVGIQAVMDKYAPRIEAARFKSGFDLHHIRIYGDLALIVGRFKVEITDRKTSEVSNASGRLVLTYRRIKDGSWKLLLDIDNNE